MRLAKIYWITNFVLNLPEQRLAEYQPDAGITFAGAKYLIFVLEVAYSETEESVIKKAKIYLKGSKGCHGIINHKAKNGSQQRPFCRTQVTRGRHVLGLALFFVDG